MRHGGSIRSSNADNPMTTLWLQKKNKNTGATSTGKLLFTKPSVQHQRRNNDRPFVSLHSHSIAQQHPLESNNKMATIFNTVMRMTNDQTVIDNNHHHDEPQLSPHTFAGMVERQLMDKFPTARTTNTGSSYNNNNIERVLQSWRLLDHDYVHHYQYNDANRNNNNSSVHSGYDNNNNNSDNMSYQLCHSYVPGLTVREFWETQPYDWCTQLKGNYTLIRDEFLSVIADMDQLQERGNNVWAKAASESELAQQYGDGWSTLVLMNRGIWDPINVPLFPVTAQTIYDCHIPAVEIFFASMQPNSTIPYHSDYTNFVLTCHLGIDIPDNGQNKCRLQVGDTIDSQQWLNGEILLFDTSIMHNATNESINQTRYILMMRIWHPELTVLEQQALQYIYDLLEFPELLVVPTPTTTGTQKEVQQQRTEMEQQILHAKRFPLLPPQPAMMSIATTVTSITNTRPTTTTMGFGTTTTKKKKKNGKK